MPLDNASIVAAFREYLRTGQDKFALEVSGVRYQASFTNFPPLLENPGKWLWWSLKMISSARLKP